MAKHTTSLHMLLRPIGCPSALPLAVIGWGVSVCHWALYKGYIPDKLVPCGEGVSCREVKLELLGFITIPMLSIMAFTIIIGLLFIYKRTSK